MPVASQRLARSARVSVAVGVVASALILLFAPADAQTDGETTRAEFNSQSWWQANTNPPPVPADALPVAAQNGAPTRWTAFDMDVFVGPDENLTNLTLRLKESTSPGANFPPPPPEQVGGQTPPQAQVQIGACPITSIYTPEEGGAAAAVPTADCEIARGDGTRLPDGTWEFDITMLAELWISNGLENKGVLLVERVAAPMSFQVAFQDLSTGTPSLEISTDLVIDEEEEAEEEIDTGGGTVTDDTDTGDDNFFSEISESTTGTTDTPLGIVNTPPTTAPSAPSDNPAPRNVANRQPTNGTLPWSMLLLVPIIMAIALVGGMVLGPAGDPATVRSREGGLSRALARRDASFASE